MANTLELTIKVKVPLTMVDLSTRELTSRAHDEIVDALIAAGTTTDIEIEEV